MRRLTYRVVTVGERRSEQERTVLLGDVLDRPTTARIRVRVRIRTLHTT